MTLSPDEMTLDELRPLLAAALPAQAAFDGWGEAALALAAAEIGIPADRAQLVFPGGAIDMIAAWFETIDVAMAAAVPAERAAGLRIRDRIAALVMARSEALAPHREALRRALPVLAFPINAPRAARLGWHAADAMWRLAGDSATDLNHYTKRLTLAGVYSATILALLDDGSDDLAPTRAFLDRRIEGIMRLEKLKARLRPDPDAHFNVARFLGRLRYPAR